MADHFYFCSNYHQNSLLFSDNYCLSFFICCTFDFLKKGLFCIIVMLLNNVNAKNDANTFSNFYFWIN